MPFAADNVNSPVPLTTALPHFFDQEALLSEIRTVLDSRILTNRGPKVLELEKKVGEFLGDPGLSMVSCANATVAAELVLRAFGVRGKVIVTPYTFVATVHAIVNAGLEPVFADIDSDTLCLSPEAVEKAITPDVVAVCPVHVYGNVCDLSYFEGLRKRGIRVLYDSAHAFGVRVGSQPVGSFGDAETFSLHATKILNACEGGLIVTRDRDLARRLALMTNFGFTGETKIELIGTNAKLSEIHAVFGLHSLKYLPDAIQVRRRLIQYYRESLSDMDGIRFLKPQPEVEGNAQYCPIFLNSETNRDKIYDALKARDIFARKYFHPLVNHFSPYIERYPAHTPVAEEAARTVLCLPLHTLMRQKDVDTVVAAIREIQK